MFDKIETAPTPRLVKPFVKPIANAISGKAKSGFIMPQIKTHLDYLEAELGKNAWFAGDEFTAADVQMSFPIEAAALPAG